MLFSLDIETTGLDRFTDKILVIGVYNPVSGFLSFDTSEEFKRWNKSDNQYIMHNGGFDVNFLRSNDCDILCQLAYDTRSIASILPTRPKLADGQTRELGLENLSMVLLNSGNYKLDRTDMSSYSKEELLDYNRKDCEITYKLFEYLFNTLSEKSWDFVEKWLGPATRLCASLEYNGIYGDWKGLSDYKTKLEILRNDRLKILNDLTIEPRNFWKQLKIKELKNVYETKKTLALSKTKTRRNYDALFEKACEKIEEFNWNSPKQLIWLLSEYYNQDLLNSRTNKITTDDEKLKSLDHPVAKALIAYREVEKLLSQQIPGLLDNIKPDECVHGRYIIGGTRTGRLSSSNPNLQQISARKPLGKKIRSFIQAREGYVLMTADQGQIEPRLIAHYSKEPKLIEAFKSEQDIYSVFANEIFGLKETNFSKEYFSSKYASERACGKTAGLSVLYGTGATKFSEMVLKETGTIIPAKRAKELIDNFRNNLERVTFFKQFLEKKMANRQIYYNLLGRPFIIENNNDLYMLALNTLIQGSASDLVVDSFANGVIPALERLKVPHKARLLVHDEIVVELPKSEADDIVKEALLPEMTSKVEEKLGLLVPLKVDYVISERWEKK